MNLWFAPHFEQGVQLWSHNLEKDWTEVEVRSPAPARGGLGWGWDSAQRLRGCEAEGYTTTQVYSQNILAMQPGAGQRFGS